MEGFITQLIINIIEGYITKLIINVIERLGGKMR